MNLRDRFIQAAREAFAGFLCEADLKDYLLKNYEEAVGTEVIDAAIEIAPKYAERLVLWNRQGDIDLKDEAWVRETKGLVKDFDRIKKIDTFKERASDEWYHELGDLNPSDINSYKNYRVFYDVVTDLEDVKSKKEEQRAKIQEGYSVVAERGPYKLYEITNVEASVALCKGMGWCTHHPDVAKQYLDDGPLYMAVRDKSGPEYLAHFESNELQDASRHEVRSQELPYDVYNMFVDAGFENELSRFGPTDEQQMETWIDNSIESISDEIQGHGELDTSELNLPTDRGHSRSIAGQVFDWFNRNRPDLAEWEDYDEQGYPSAMSPSPEDYITALTALGYIELTEEERRERGPLGPGYWQDPGYDPSIPYGESAYEEQPQLGLEARYLRAVREHYAGFLCAADLRDYLSKYEAKVGAPIIDKAVEIAPKYAERIIIWTIDAPSMDITKEPWEKAVRDSLKAFDRIKKLDEFKEAAKEYGVYYKGNPSDINSYARWGDFANVVDDLANVTSKADTLRQKIQEGYTKLAEHKGWSVYELTNQEATTALCKDRAWCVKDPEFGEDYLEEGPLYIVVEGKSPEYLLHLQGVSGTPEMQDRSRANITWDELDYGAQVVLDKAKLAGQVEELFPDEEAADEEEEAERLREEEEQAERQREANLENSHSETWSHLDSEYGVISLTPDWNEVLERLEGRPYHMEYDAEYGSAIKPDRSQVVEVMEELGMLDEESIWEEADENTTRRIYNRAMGEGGTSWTDWSQGPLVRQGIPSDFDEQMFAWLLQNHPDQVRDESLREAAEDLSGVIPDSEYVALAAVALGFATPQAVQIYNIVFQGEEEQPTGPAYYEQPGYEPPPEEFVSPYEEQPALMAARIAAALLRGELVA